MTHPVTLNLIRKHKPCAEGWAKLLAHLGKTQADNEPLYLSTILASNGWDDALWCLRAVPDQRAVVDLACRYAERVLHVWEAQYPNDMRPHEAIAAARSRDATTSRAVAAAARSAAGAARSAAGAARSAAEAAAGAAWARAMAMAMVAAKAKAEEWAATEAAETVWAAEMAVWATAAEREAQQRIFVEIFG